MGAIAKLRPERSVFDVVERHYLAAKPVPFLLKRTLQRPNTLGRIILQDPLENECVVSVHQRGVTFIPARGASARSELRDVIVERFHVLGRVLPLFVRDQALAIHVFPEQTVEGAVLDSGRNFDGIAKRSQTEKESRAKINFRFHCEPDHLARKIGTQGDNTQVNHDHEAAKGTKTLRGK